MATSLPVLTVALRYPRSAKCIQQLTNQPAANVADMHGSVMALLGLESMLFLQAS